LLKIKILLFLLLPAIFFAEVPHETRAVWITTNFGLDFPNGIKDPVAQQNYLRKIFRTIREKNFNTVYFQVRSNGTVLFNSSYEPYSSELTGFTGGDPAYDPTAMAISLAREEGLEIHAWVNTFRCFSGNNREVLLNAKHPFKTHSKLVKSFSDGGNLSYWMDPGQPETQAYLVDLFTELVTKYNFDGLQLDFIRYPGKNFDDGNTYNLYGANQKKDDWRRGNITKFISDLKKSLRTVNPHIKLGATPIGIYKNPEGFYGFQAYYDVYQDVESWIAGNLVDYIVPQIYWDIKTAPFFSSISAEWIKLKKKCQVIVGIGAYKDEVKRELKEQINVTRNLGAEGVAFFRYENISNEYLFSEPALPSAYKTGEVLNLPQPQNLSAAADPLLNNNLKLSWEFDNKFEDKLKYFAIYEVASDAPSLLKLVEPSSRSFILSDRARLKQVSYFSVGCVDVNWNEKDVSSNKIRVENKALISLLDKVTYPNEPVLTKSGDGFILSYYSKRQESLEITATKGTDQLFFHTVSLVTGLNIIPVAVSEKPDFIELKFPEKGESRRLKL